MSSLCFTGHREFINTNDNNQEQRFREYLIKLLVEYVEKEGETDRSASI